MKQNYVAVILAIGLGASTCFAQFKQWDKTFGGNKSDGVFSLQQTADGGYIFGGLSNSDQSGDKSQGCQGEYDFWVVKTDSAGNKIWDRRFGGFKSERLTDIKQTFDKGYIIGGYTDSQQTGDISQGSQGSADFWIIKADTNGNKIWDRRFGGTDFDTLYSLQQTTDEGFILGGTSSSGQSGDKSQPSQGNPDYWIIKTDTNGIKQWDKRFGGSDHDNLAGIQQTSDGGYILGGTSSSGQSGDKSQGSQGSQDFWIVKVDSAGNKQWDKTFGGSGDDMCMSIQKTSDGGYILGGTSSSGQSGDKSEESRGEDDFWIIKTDANGNKLWDKRYGGSGYDQLYSLQQTMDGGYILGGRSLSDQSGDKSQNAHSYGYEDFWIIKIDSFGNKEWDTRLGGLLSDSLLCVKQTRDRGFICGGVSASGISGDKSQGVQDTGEEYIGDMWIVKVAVLKAHNDFSHDYTSDVTTYNPTSGRWSIRFSNGGDTNFPWGFTGAVPVCGDYDGDGRADPAIFHSASGQWFIMTLRGYAVAWSTAWGFAGAVPVCGDYDGDGKDDLAIYNEGNGRWFIYSLAKKKTLGWDINWGWKGAKPVCGDYDGDGRADLAVLDANVGNWYIYSLAKNRVLVWNQNWGWSGCAYVPGDFDGDGISDLGVYDKTTSTWFIYSVATKKAMAWNVQWGFAGATMVSGDYNGDSAADLAAYNQTTGKWYIRTLTGTVLMWDQSWGGNAWIPVKP